jgi:hypothetical protein
MRTKCARAWAGLLLGAAQAACGTSSSGAGPMPDAAADAALEDAPDAAADAALEDAPDAGMPSCARNEVPLVTTRDDGVADAQVIPVRVDGQQAWLALDTGAPFTFLYSDINGPEYVEEAGTVEIGCETWTVPGFRQDAIGVEPFEGKPILGIVGLDFFQQGPAELDYPGGRMVRYRAGAPPAELEAFPALPLHGDDRALVDVTLDQEPLTLMLDTGAHDTLWLGVTGGPDDELSQVQTADGAVWDVYIGTGILELPGEAPRVVRVQRALDVGYIKPELDELGAQGLFGLTSLGWRRILFDFEGGVIRLGPRAR